MNALEAGMLDVGINLCRRNTDMAQHHLNGPQISTVIQQMGGKGVAEHMWGDRFGYSCAKGSAFEYFPETLSSERSA